MKTFRKIAVLVGGVIAGLLVWRKVESDRLRNDLWAEAEQAPEHREVAQPQMQPVPAHVTER